jgi:hypothetical protein
MNQSTQTEQDFAARIKRYIEIVVGDLEVEPPDHSKPFAQDNKSRFRKVLKKKSPDMPGRKCRGRRDTK